MTDEHLWTAASYYSILAKSPPEIRYFLSGIVGLGAATILWSLRDGEAGNLMFDGGSICSLALIFLNSHQADRVQFYMVQRLQCTFLP